MDEGADGSGALHSVGEPDVQGELSGLASCASKNTQGYPGQAQSTQGGKCPGLYQGNGRLNVRDVQGIEALVQEGPAVEEKIEDGKKEAEVPDTGDQKGFLCRSGGSGSVVPEANEQVGTQPHQLPHNVQLDYVARYDQSNHGRGEQGHEGEVPDVAGVSLHVAVGVDLDHEADACYDHQHYGGERVHHEAHAQVHPGNGEPGVPLKGQRAVFYDRH